MDEAIENSAGRDHNSCRYRLAHGAKLDDFVVVVDLLTLVGMDRTRYATDHCQLGIICRSAAITTASTATQTAWKK